MHAHMPRRSTPLPSASSPRTHGRSCQRRPHIISRLSSQATRGSCALASSHSSPTRRKSAILSSAAFEFGSVSAALDWAARLGTPSHLMQEAPREGVQAAIPVTGRVLIRMQVVQCKLRDQLRRATPQPLRSTIPAWAHVTFPEVGKRCRTPRHVHGAGQVLTSEAGI